MSDLERPVVRRAGDGSPVVPAPSSQLESAPRVGESRSPSQTPKYGFKVPETARLHGPKDPSSFVLRELTDDEMLQVEKVSKGSNQKYVTEAVKLSLEEVDGKPVDHSQAEAEFYWAKWSSKVRFLSILAWKQVHQTDEKEDAAFLKSMSIL